jgi:predicted ATP-binding protein involved in virulence
MELIYLWIKEHKNISNQGFNFSPRFECKFDGSNLIVTKNKDYDISIFPDNINITLIVGENGSGKTSILSTILDFFIEYNDSIIIFAIDKKLYSNYKIYNYDEKIEILDTSSILGKNNKYLSVITNTSDFQNTEFFLNRELNIYEDLHPMSVKENYFELTNDFLKLNYNDLNGFQNALVFSNIINNVSSIFNPTEYKIDLNRKYIKRRLFDIVLYTDRGEDSEIKLMVENYINKIFEEKDMKYIINFYLFLTKYIEASNPEYYDFTETYVRKNILKDISHNSSYDTFIDLLNNVYRKDLFLSISKNKDNLRNLSKYEIFNKLIGKLFLVELKEEYRTYSMLSYGEKNSLIQEGLFYKNIMSSDKNNILILLDEDNIAFHPIWQKQNLNNIITYLKQFKDKNIHLVITTHSPFLLSDVPKENVIFLVKYDNNIIEKYPNFYVQDLKNGNCINISNEIKILNTFGANIHTLLSNGFFMKDGLMGEFAKKEINQIIENLNSKNYNPNIEEKKKILMIINIIGEDFLRTKLLDMYYKKFDDDLIKQQRKNELELQKAKIEEELKNL